MHLIYNSHTVYRNTNPFCQLSKNTCMIFFSPFINSYLFSFLLLLHTFRSPLQVPISISVQLENRLNRLFWMFSIHLFFVFFLFCNPSSLLPTYSTNNIVIGNIAPAIISYKFHNWNLLSTLVCLYSILLSLFPTFFFFSSIFANAALMIYERL